MGVELPAAGDNGVLGAEDFTLDQFRSRLMLLKCAEVSTAKTWFKWLHELQYVDDGWW